MHPPHATLLEARKLIDSGRIRLLSLDIFDTTVWRTFPAPTDLFFALGARLIERGLLFPSTSAASFAMERREAEQAARLRRISDREVTLSEIYQAFPSGLLRAGNSTADLIRAELELERQSTFHDPAIVELIDYAASKGIPTAFVSDTYFEEDHLRAILPRPGSPHLVVNSCRYRKPKALGLHAEVLRQTGWKASQILHIGDNRQADFEAPRELGMAAIWRPRMPEHFRKAWSWSFPGTYPNAPTYFPGTGDAGLSAVRARAVDTPENWNDPCAPGEPCFWVRSLAGFGKWVIERCRDGRHPDGAMPDARGPHSEARCWMNSAPGFKRFEFFASRYAAASRLHFPTATSAEIQSFLARPQPTRALRSIGASGDRLLGPRAGWRRADFRECGRRTGAEDRQDPRLKGRAIAASGEARRRLMAYFRKTVPAREATHRGGRFGLFGHDSALPAENSRSRKRPGQHPWIVPGHRKRRAKDPARGQRCRRIPGGKWAAFANRAFLHAIAGASGTMPDVPPWQHHRIRRPGRSRAGRAAFAGPSTGGDRTRAAGVARFCPELRGCAFHRGRRLPGSAPFLGSDSGPRAHRAGGG